MGSTFVDSDYGDTVESQLTLGTASLLGIFFGLVMVCGIFFGFGYSMGRHNAAALSASSPILPQPTHAVPAPVTSQPMAAPAARSEATLTPALPSPQPAPSMMASAVAPTSATLPAARAIDLPVAAATHSPLSNATARPVTVPSANSQPTLATDHAYVEPKSRIPKPSAIQPTVEQTNVRIPLQKIAPGPQFTAQNLPSPYFVWTPPFDVHYKKGFRHNLMQTAASHQPLTGVSHPSGAYASPRPVLSHVSVNASLSNSAAGPAMTVQVAALSRQDDAEVLVSALRQRGFAPSIQSGSEDALYHVQVGPFSRDVAFATRQRLIAKGYNATLK